MFRQLNAFIKKHGVSLTSALLHLRDTHTIKNWVKREEIPDRWKPLVKKMLEDFKDWDIDKIIELVRSKND